MKRILFLTLVGFALSAEEEKPRALPPVVVTPSRHEADPFRVPYSLTVLEADGLQRERSVRQLTDALAEVPGVMLQKTSYGQASPFIRGFTGFRTLMLIDGIRLNNSVFRSGPNQYWATVDPLSISRMELLKGPASALYGSDAVGGTLNALTRTRDPRDGGGWERRALVRASSAEHSMTERAEVSGLFGERLGASLGHSHKDFGDLDAGSPTGGQPYTGYHERDWDGSLVWRLNPETALILARQEVEQKDVPRTHSTVFAKTFHGTAPGTDLRRDLDQRRELTYLKLKAEDLEATAFYHVQGEQQDRIQAASLDAQGFEVDTLGVSLQMQNPTKAVHFTYGAEFSHDAVESWRGNFNAAGDLLQWRPRGPVADNAGYDLLGIYAQDEITLGKRWDLTLGTRYTHAAADANQVADPFDSLAAVKAADSVHREWDDLSSSARLLWKATSEVHPFAGISQGFRAPNLSDLTQFDAARSGEVNIPSPGLDPEHYLSKEIGVKGRTSAFEGQAAYYHTEIQDAIERAPTGDLSGTNRVVKRLNVGNGYVQGVELEGDLRFARDWKAFANAQWQEGEVDTFVTSSLEDKDKRPMSRIAPRSGLLGFRWAPDHAKRPWAEASCQVVDAQDRLSPDDDLDNQRIPPGGPPGYKVFNLRAGVDLVQGTSLTVALENLLDENYRSLGSGTNSPGMNLVATVDSRF